MFYFLSPEEAAILQLWKLPHIVKGALTYLPPLNALRVRRASTGGTSSPEYCFLAWHKHLQWLRKAGFSPEGTRMAELGPGDTVGLGLAALLSGVRSYVGLDLVPYAASKDPLPLFDKLCSIAAGAEDPDQRIAVSDTDVQRLRGELQRGVNRGDVLRYEAPWTCSSVATESLDLVLSMGALQSVDRLEEAYEAMFRWLRPGGFASHWIGLSAGHLSPYWNGHWAYSDLEWSLVRGKREFTVNRTPLSGHVRMAGRTGFDILVTDLIAGTDGLPREELAPGFRDMDPLDAGTRSTLLVMRRPV